MGRTPATAARPIGGLTAILATVALLAGPALASRAPRTGAAMGRPAIEKVKRAIHASGFHLRQSALFGRSYVVVIESRFETSCTGYVVVERLFRLSERLPFRVLGVPGIIDSPNGPRQRAAYLEAARVVYGAEARLTDTVSLPTGLEHYFGGGARPPKAVGTEQSRGLIQHALFTYQVMSIEHLLGTRDGSAGSFSVIEASRQLPSVFAANRRMRRELSSFPVLRLPDAERDIEKGHDISDATARDVKGLKSFLAQAARWYRRVLTPSRNRRLAQVIAARLGAAPEGSCMVVLCEPAATRVGPVSLQTILRARRISFFLVSEDDPKGQAQLDAEAARQAPRLDLIDTHPVSF